MREEWVRIPEAEVNDSGDGDVRSGMVMWKDMLDGVVFLSAKLAFS